jgi:hypothetical protein
MRFFLLPHVFFPSRSALGADGNDNREIQGVLGSTDRLRTGAGNPLVEAARASGNAGAVETQKHGRRSFDDLMGYRRRGSPTVIHTAVLLHVPSSSSFSSVPFSGGLDGHGT